MIVYADRSARIATHACIEHAREAVELSLLSSTRDNLRDALIAAGALECAASDAVGDDSAAGVVQTLRSATLATARAFVHTDAAPARAHLHAAASFMRASSLEALPATLTLKEAEGFAWYAVYPEMYAAAARELAVVAGGRSVCCIGIRTIGATLSAVVHAALEQAHCTAESWTLRPTGHPFNRRADLPQGPSAALAQRDAAMYAIIDEGPGISGSSFGAVAGALRDAGVHDENIVLMPSWRPTPDALTAESGRAAFRRHRAMIATFEENPPDVLRTRARYADWSAGYWRNDMYPRREAAPAVQPRHERRKYRVDNSLLKFAGFGRRARAQESRAAVLFDAGWSTRPHGVRDGFLELEIAQGVPLTSRGVTATELDTFAAYHAFVAATFATGRSADTDRLRGLVETNSSELGVALPAGRLDEARQSAAGTAVALDGRMLPHEWLRTREGLLKLDALDHHCDHFFPGESDIAWDLAGTAVEFELEHDAELYLTREYVRGSRDTTIARRLPFYRVAYSAFRAGYAALAADTLGPSTDGVRFRALTDRYTRRLKHEIGRL